MLVRKCDVCGHSIEDGEVGYVADIFRTSLPRGAEMRSRGLEASIEICYDCNQAMFSALNERMTKYVLQGQKQEEEE